MRDTPSSKDIAQLADTVNLRELLDQPADFLLQSGCAGGPHGHPRRGAWAARETPAQGRRTARPARRAS